VTSMLPEQLDPPETTSNVSNPDSVGTHERTGPSKPSDHRTEGTGGAGVPRTKTKPPFTPLASAGTARGAMASPQNAGPLAHEFAVAKSSVSPPPTTANSITLHDASSSRPKKPSDAPCEDTPAAAPENPPQAHTSPSTHVRSFTHEVTPALGHTLPASTSPPVGE
jgi:hypothetical protein